jgi:hypothetical protein
MPIEHWRGKWVLVTGASSGIGLALAKAFAAGGANLVLTARRIDRLSALAMVLKDRHGADVRIVPVDLNHPQAPRELFEYTQGQGIAIDVLVNNAGLASYGEFHASDLDVQLSMVQVHCHAAVHLTHLFLPGMVARRSGYMLMVATTTLAPVPYIAVYAATKGFDQLFGEALREEVARHGVKVSVLCPAPTQSEMHVHVGSEEEHNHKLQSVDEVAQRALSGLAASKACIRPSWSAKLTAFLPRLLPRATISGAAEHVYRPRHLN